VLVLVSTKNKDSHDEVLQKRVQAGPGTPSFRVLPGTLNDQGSGLRRDLRGKGRFPVHRFYPACGRSIRPVNLAAREVSLVGEADAVGVFITRHVGEDDLIADL
jgi:hypothetical protein